MSKLFNPSIWADAIMDAYVMQTSTLKGINMGCDIHVWIEKKEGDRWKLHRPFNAWHIDKPDEDTEDTDDSESDRIWKYTWEHFPDTNDRNYERFAKLAGVRGEGPAAKGLPEDVCPELRDLDENPDLHSHTWCHPREAAAIWAETQWPGSPRYEFIQANPMVMIFGIDETKENVDDYRIIIAFDN